MQSVRLGPAYYRKKRSSAGGLASLDQSDDADSTPFLAFNGIFHGIDCGVIFKKLKLNGFCSQKIIEWESLYGGWG